MQYIVEAIDFFAFITAISVAICFLPPAINVFDIWSRLALSPAQYMVIQRLNGGASFFGVGGLLVPKKWRTDQPSSG